MSNVLKENYKKLVDALAPYFGGASDFDELLNRPQESDAIDIDDLDLPMPAKPTEYPVLFDETGTEYQVGLYKRASDGKVKPIWRKEITDIQIGELNTWTTVDISSLNVEKITRFYFDMGSGVWNTYLPPYVNADWSITTIELKPVVASYANKTAFVTLEYTKTTDSWKEV